MRTDKELIDLLVETFENCEVYVDTIWPSIVVYRIQGTDTGAVGLCAFMLQMRKNSMITREESFRLDTILRENMPQERENNSPFFFPTRKSHNVDPYQLRLDFLRSIQSKITLQ